MRGTRRRLSATLTASLVLVVFAALGGSDRTSARGKPAEPSGGAEATTRAATVQAAAGSAEMQAMALAYPTRISRTEVRDGEWALLMDDRWYYWADGRLLPEGLRASAESYVGIRFYGYELGPVRDREITPELEVRLRERSMRQNTGGDTRERFNDFLDNLYQIGSQEDAERLVRRVEFMGHATRVHPLLVEPLAQVERTIRAIAPYDPEVAGFVDGLAAVHGYNWRNIAGTVRRSYHSYGIAVDLVPRSYRGQWPYWLWAFQGGVDSWWDIPPESRWNVPQGVIDAFEANGFVWGGKWLFFDNLHFEYRPESIILADPSPGA